MNLLGGEKRDPNMGIILEILKILITLSVWWLLALTVFKSTLYTHYTHEAYRQGAWSIEATGAWRVVEKWVDTYRRAPLCRWCAAGRARCCRRSLQCSSGIPPAAPPAASTVAWGSTRERRSMTACFPFQRRAQAFHLFRPSPSSANVLWLTKMSSPLPRRHYQSIVDASATLSACLNRRCPPAPGECIPVHLRDTRDGPTAKQHFARPGWAHPKEIWDNYLILNAGERQTIECTQRPTHSFIQYAKVSLLGG